jgi:lipoic acid synthetase
VIPPRQNSPKPRWLRAPLGGGERYKKVKATLGTLRLHTVCEGANCPNAGECWSAGTATFLLMGPTCTRGCRFCDVPSAAHPPPLDPEEPARVARAVDELGLDYSVLTSVDRDDLPDGGAAHFAETIRLVKALGRPRVEALTPDFGGDAEGVRTIGRASPDVFGQNLETVRRLAPSVRDPRSGYDVTLEALARMKREFPGVLTKSSLLLGLGEAPGEVTDAMRDLRGAGVELLTLGQYLQPSPRQLPVAEWIPPERFAALEAEAYGLGFRFVASGPLVRSSYRAAEQFVRGAVLAAAVALAVGGCAGRPIPPTGADPRAYGQEAWQSPLERTHPLVGYALSTRDGRWVDAAEIGAAVAKADFVFLGETHDNLDHHRLQAALLRATLAGGRRPALAFEMLDTSQAEPLARCLAAPEVTPGALDEATGWKRSGWPDLSAYWPIFEVGLGARLPIAAANLPRAAAREAVRKGMEALPLDVREAMERAGEPSPGELRQWAREMAESHCQELDPGLLQGLVRAQRARDAQMALAVAAAARSADGAVLVTGDGHARTDRGVPAWLQRVRPAGTRVSIGLLEADGDLRWPREYAEEYGDALPFDFVIFTPRAEREDPCEPLRRRNRDAAAKERQ